MQNVRHSLRMLLKQPLFSGIVILTFALGIGANSAVFNVINAVLLRPLPYYQAERLVALSPYDIRQSPNEAKVWDSASYPDFADWRAQNKVFENAAVFTSNSLTLTDGNEATQIHGESVSAATLSLLGVQPFLGRAFSAKEDEPGNRVVILSHALWQRQFGSDPGIVGRSINLDGRPYEVIGVMPRGFAYPVKSMPVELWTTVAGLRQTPDGSQPMTEQRGNSFLFCVARLKPGISLEQAQANIDNIAAVLRAQYPESNTYVGVKVVPLLDAIVGDAHAGLLMLCGMAGCVLLIACVNVANLLLARSLARQREISIRSALGAGRFRIVKQLVTESTVLSAFGGLCGLLLSIWAVDLLREFLPANVPRIDQVSTDWRVLVFAVGISFAVGILAGLFPAWRASRYDITGSLNESARGSTEGARGRRTRAALVVAEIVLALVLLSSAGLLVESFIRLSRVRPGFDPTNVMTARITLPDVRYGKPAQAAEFYRRLLERVSNLPGVESATCGWWLPLSGNEIVFNFDIQQRPVPKAQQALAQVNVVVENYFNGLRMPLLKGRDFGPRDTERSAQVAIVNESFVHEFFPGEDPVGKYIRPNGSVSPGEPPMREIVGVVGDSHLISLSAKPKPQIYIPHAQFAVQGMSLIVRTQMNPANVTNALRGAVTEIDKGVPLFRIRTLSDYLSSSIAQPRFHAVSVTLFSVIALLLASAGIFGVMSFAVTQRTQEIGIRLALGAQRGQVLKLILADGMKLVGLGVVLGIAGIVAMSRVLRSVLYGIAPTDLPTILAVTFLLALVALAACWLPARRAANVDPIVALRTE